MAIISILFCTFAVPKNIHQYANKFLWNFWSCRARAEVFPLHPAAVGLAQTEVAARRRSGTGALGQAETPHVSTDRSKNYLPTIWAAITALF